MSEYNDQTGAAAPEARSSSLDAHAEPAESSESLWVARLNHPEDHAPDWCARLQSALSESPDREASIRRRLAEGGSFAPVSSLTNLDLGALAVFVETGARTFGAAPWGGASGGRRGGGERGLKNPRHVGTHLVYVPERVPGLAAVAKSASGGASAAGAAAVPPSSGVAGAAWGAGGAELPARQAEPEVAALKRLRITIIDDFRNELPSHLALFDGLECLIRSDTGEDYPGALCVSGAEVFVEMEDIEVGSSFTVHFDLIPSAVARVKAL